MKVRFDEAQDLTLQLTSEEEKVLSELKSPTKYFFGLHKSAIEPCPETGRLDILFRGLCAELKAYVFLGRSLDGEGIFRESGEDRTVFDIFSYGKISIPSPDLSGSPWFIDLSLEGIEHFKRGLHFGIRYNGSNKLFIREVKIIYSLNSFFNYEEKTNHLRN